MAAESYIECTKVLAFADSFWQMIACSKSLGYVNQLQHAIFVSLRRLYFGTSQTGDHHILVEGL